MKSQTTVLRIGGLHWATSEPVIEKTLARRPGVLAVRANASSQTATVTYDPDTTSMAQLVGWVRECGYHCAGQSVPAHMCDPMTEPDNPARHASDGAPVAGDAHVGHAPSAEPEAHGGNGGEAAPPATVGTAVGRMLTSPRTR